MATTPSLEATGLTVLTEEDVFANMIEGLQGKSAWGSQVSYGDDDPLGQILRVVSGQIGDVYALQRQQYDAFDRDAAEGVALDNANGFAGVERDPATHSQGEVTLSGTAGTLVPAGNRFRVGADGPMVELDASAEIQAGGSVTADASAVEAGAVEINASAVDTIVDPVTGLDSVTNASAFVAGDPLEDDPTYRERGEASFSLSGSGTDFAIDARLEEDDDVTSAAVISNRSDSVDTYGHPSRSVAIYIWPSGLDSAAVAQLIWEQGAPPAGMRLVGDQVYYVTDPNGFKQEIRWYVATELEMHCNIGIASTNDDYPTNGDDLVKAAVVAWGNALGQGTWAASASLEAYVRSQVPGILAFGTTEFQATGDATWLDPYAVTPVEITRWATARVTVS